MSLTGLCVYALLMTAAIGASPAGIICIARHRPPARQFFWGLGCGLALGVGATATAVWLIVLSAWVQ